MAHITPRARWRRLLDLVLESLCAPAVLSGVTLHVTDSGIGCPFCTWGL